MILSKDATLAFARNACIQQQRTIYVFEVPITTENSTYIYGPAGTQKKLQDKYKRAVNVIARYEFVDGYVYSYSND